MASIMGSTVFTQGSRMFRFSLREVLVVFLVLCVSLASLRAGDPMAVIVLITGFAFLVAMAINAFVADGSARAFAIGFLIPGAMYAMVLLAVVEDPLDPFSREFPGSEIVRHLHQVVVSKTYYDMQGNPISDYDSTKYQVVALGLGGFGGGGFGGVPGGMSPPGKTAVSMVEGIDRGTFMTIVHGVIAMFCGWIGGKYAVCVSQRNE